jgi:hypothetical protein
VRHLAALGSELILVVPASMPVETLGTLVDLPGAIDFARLDPGVDVVTLAAWGNDDVLVSELAERVEEALAEPG